MLLSKNHRKDCVFLCIRQRLASEDILFGVVRVPIRVWWRLTNTISYRHLVEIPRNILGAVGDRDQLTRFWGQNCQRL